MLSLIATFMIVYIELIKHTSLVSLTHQEYNQSIVTNVKRFKRELLHPNEYLWDDDVGLYTDRPQLDREIVYGKVNSLPMRSRLGSLREKHNSKFNSGPDLNISASKTIKIKHTSIEDGKERVGSLQQKKAKASSVESLKTQDKLALDIGIAGKHMVKQTKEARLEERPPVAFREHKLEQSRRNHQALKQSLIDHEISNAAYVLEPKVGEIKRFRKENKPRGELLEYTKMRNGRRKKITLLQHSNKNNDQLHERIEYDTPHKNTKLHTSLVRHKSGEVVLSHTHGVKHREGQSHNAFKPKVIHAETVVQVPFKRWKKLNHQVLLSNKISKQNAKMNHEFLKLLYNLTVQNAQKSAEKHESAAVHIPAPHWTEWSPWGSCSVTCGKGVQYRSRVCMNGQKRHRCHGEGVEKRRCDHRKCQSKGTWSSWSPWSHCSATCGLSRKHRTRECKRPPSHRPAFDCIGKGTQKDMCSTRPCVQEIRERRVVFATEGEQAVLLCNYKMSYKVQFVHWLAPSGETITTESSSSKYKVEGNSLIIKHPEKVDAGTYKCVVTTKKHGKVIARASMVVEDCTTNPCQNGGVCVEKKSTSAPPYSVFYCSCPTGYYGRRCTVGIGPGGMAAIVIAVITAVLFIIIMVLLCNHRNAQRHARTDVGDMQDKTDQRKTNTFERFTIPEDHDTKLFAPEGLKYFNDTDRDSKREDDNEQEIYLLGSPNVLRFNHKVGFDSHRPKPKSILSEHAGHPVRKQGSVSFTNDERELQKHESTNHVKLPSPPPEFSGNATFLEHRY